MYSALSTIRENSIENKWKFQGQEHQTDFDLNWYAFKWRNHQPDIGRFFNVDPISDDFPQWSNYVFSGNFVTISKELEGLEPKFMIDGNGKLTSPITRLFNAAFGSSVRSLGNTTWIPHTDKRANKLAQYAVPNNAVAITLGEQVVFDNALKKGISNSYWFELIGHEQTHRRDIDKMGNTLFYGLYVLDGAATFGEHDRIGAEIVANNIEDYSTKLWKYNSGEVSKILNDNSLSNSVKSSKLEAVGAKFRRDVILSDKIKTTKSSINKIKTAIDGLNTEGEDKAIQEALDQLINGYKQKIKEYKKQQNNITNRYGK